MLADCEMFPSNAIFNTRIDDVSRFPKHPQSDSWVAFSGPNLQMGANWSAAANPADLGGYFGLPINYVDGTSATTDWPVVSFDYLSSGLSSEPSYPQKSDCAMADASGFSIVRDCTSIAANQRRFPFPKSNVLVEGGNCGGPTSCGDHHVLVVERGACRLWESFYSHNIAGQWYTVATAAWDLKSLSLRPYDWASADAAGLPITPLLAKPAEASTGEIRHALRVSFSVIAHAVQWPARFGNSGAGNPAAMPFGALLRLKADFQIPDSWSPQTKAIALAAKRYGLYVADNGPDFYVQGEPSSAWDGRAWNELKGITLSDMEFVDLRSVTSDPRFSPDSMAASW
jgi:hypothetical protein